MRIAAGPGGCFTSPQWHRYEYEAFHHPDDSRPAINHAWLDVACINQTPGSAEMASEIGRQAKIFKGAAQTFVWLTKLSREEYQQQLGRECPTGSLADQARGCMDCARLQVEQLSQDPWFSSLWTLQEAYLCPRAVFITRDGELLSQDDSITPPEDTLLLSDFIDFCSLHWDNIIDREHSHQTPGPDDEYAQRLKDSLQRSGMIGLRWTLPTTLFAAARHRETSKENIVDRVSGIMQVVGFRLGKSRPGCDPNHKLSLDELEDEFGRELLQHEPIMSQMHVFNNPPRIGKGWRVSYDSQPTRRLHNVNHTYGEGKTAFEGMERKAQLSTVALENITWGRFHGGTCRLSTLARIWDSILPGGGGIIDLDGSEHWTAIHDPILAREEVTAFAQNHPDALVLLLGIQKKEGSPQCLRIPIGLLLVPHSVPSSKATNLGIWRRVGLCEWWTVLPGYDSEAIRTLEGNSSDWVDQSGIFG
ncbi:hypothetical protein LY78DRAFT_376285 [Colletotrichum sublineola]|nr:hypothetical protein LY78DRAFT_376285 [Colletotrichum sublineola]